MSDRPEGPSGPDEPPQSPEPPQGPPPPPPGGSRARGVLIGVLATISTVALLSLAGVLLWFGLRGEDDGDDVGGGNGPTLVITPTPTATSTSTNGDSGDNGDNGGGGSASTPEPVPASRTVVGAGETEPGETVELAANCPDGREALGGGYWVEHRSLIGPRLFPVISAPDRDPDPDGIRATGDGTPHGWVVRAHNVGGRPDAVMRFRAFAVCADTDVRFAFESSTVRDGETADLDATCPGDRVASGAGFYSDAYRIGNAVSMPTDGGRRIGEGDHGAPDGWEASLYVHEPCPGCGGEAATQLTVLCVERGPRRTVVRHPSDPGSTEELEAACPSGTTATGGGAAGVDEEVILFRSQPWRDGWDDPTSAGTFGAPAAWRAAMLPGDSDRLNAVAVVCRGSG